MSNAKNLFSVHRFRDELAITACDHEEGATVYLSLDQAKQALVRMFRIVKSLEREEFGQSSRLSWSTDVRDKRFTHCLKFDRKDI